MNTVEKGRKWEEYAASFLENLGYVILERNFYIKGGELDLIAQDGDTLVFVEVRYRKKAAFGLPSETIDMKKQSFIKKAAQQYLITHNAVDCYCRFDVIGILGDGEKVEIVHDKDAFQ